MSIVLRIKMDIHIHIYIKSSSISYIVSRVKRVYLLRINKTVKVRISAFVFFLFLSFLFFFSSRCISYIIITHTDDNGLRFLCPLGTMPIIVRAIVRWPFYRHIQTLTSSAWRSRPTTLVHVAPRENSPRSRCCTSITSIKSCFRDYQAWSSRDVDAHSLPL